jgi:hypothetical protein
MNEKQENKYNINKSNVSSSNGSGSGNPSPKGGKNKESDSFINSKSSEVGETPGEINYDSKSIGIKRTTSVKIHP